MVNLRGPCNMRVLTVVLPPRHMAVSIQNQRDHLLWLERGCGIRSLDHAAHWTEHAQAGVGKHDGTIRISGELVASRAQDISSDAVGIVFERNLSPEDVKEVGEGVGGH